jgi:cysteine desulfurase/selenocysteine lyase
MEISKAWDFFPHTKTGTIYFNHAATGPLSTFVTNKLNEYLKERSLEKIDNFPKVKDYVKSTKEDLGKYLNCSPDRIAYTDNTTNGINILASGINWSKGDRILLNDIEFPANVYPFLNLQKDGVIIDFVKSHDGIVSADDIISNIRPDTKLVSISFVQFLTGYRADLEKIGEYCKEKGIIFCVDAIQGLGALRLDVKKCKVDFLSCGTQKWMLGLQGFAFIYLTEDLQDKLQPKYAGWLSVENAWDFLHYELIPLKSAERFQYGTISHIGVFAFRGALDFFQSFRWEDIEKQTIEVASYLSNQLEEIGIKTFLAGCAKGNLSGIVSFKHNESQKVYDYLTSNQISCAVREGVIRLSPHFYNTFEECDKLVGILKKNNR